jgi:ParB family transcriptional regulator, chromosome partitioning protein
MDLQLDAAAGEVVLLQLDQVTANPFQPRTEFDEEALGELVASLRVDGMLQAILVRQAGEGYEVIAGERRLRAARLAGLATIPAVVRNADDEQMLRFAVVENVQRSALNPIEEGLAYAAMSERTGATQAEIAAAVGKSRQWVSHHLGLLRLPEQVQRRVAAGVLSRGHAKALMGLQDPRSQLRLAERIVAEGLTVRNVEEIVLLGEVGPTPVRTLRRRPPAQLEDVATRLTDWLDTRVRVQAGKSRGRIVVEFSSTEDLDRILDLMSAAQADPRTSGG